MTKGRVFNTATFVESNVSASASRALGQTPAVGDYLILTVSLWRNGGATISSITDTVESTWASAATKTQVNIHTAVYYRKVTNATQPTITLNFSGSAVYAAWSVQIVDCINGTSPVDKTGTAGATAAVGTMTVTAGSANAQDREFVVAVASVDSGDNPINITDPPSGWISAGVEQDGNSVVGFQASTKFAVDTETSSITWGIGTTTHMFAWAAVIVSFKVTFSLTATGPFAESIDGSSHFLRDSNGDPWLALLDTGWEHPMLSSLQDIFDYADLRSAQSWCKGVMVSAATAESGGVGWAAANLRGEFEFTSQTLSSPTSNYWKFVDLVVDIYASRGLTVFLLPFYVDNVGHGYSGLSSTTIAQNYGQWIGARYAAKTNLVWVLGGDNNPNGTQITYWNAMAKGIAIGINGTEDYTGILMTYHPNGAPPDVSTTYFTLNSPWLKIDMWQVWGTMTSIPGDIATSVGSSLVPVGLGEGDYEANPSYPDAPVGGLQIRQQAWWTWLSGGCYFIHGDTNVWQLAPSAGHGYAAAEATNYWKNTISTNGTTGLQVVRDTLAALTAWQDLRYDATPSLFSSAPTRTVASYSGIEALIYVPTSGTLTVDPTAIGWTLGAHAVWIDPADGTTSSSADITTATSKTTPGGWSDAILKLTKIENTSLAASIGGVSDYLENQLIDHVFRTATFSKPTHLYMALYTAAPSDAGGGTEVSGGSYARVALDPANANWDATQGGNSGPSTGTSGQTANSSAITFPAPTANWGHVTHVGIFDASTGGDLLFWGPLTTARTVNNGDAAPSFATGALVVTLG